MGSIVAWILGIVMAAFGLLCLFAASQSHDGLFSFFSLIFTVFSFFFMFILIKNNVGVSESH